MAGTYTTRTGKLYKPAAGDTVNVTTDVNNNMDALDTYAMGFTSVANSSSRPTTVWPGLCIIQASDNTTWVSNGSSPASASWINIPNGQASESFTFTGAATTTDAITSKVTGDSNSRFVLNSDGSQEWGSGSASTDVTLSRRATAELKTSGSLTAAKNLSVGASGAPSLGGGVGVLTLADATTAPASNPTGGLVAYSSSGQLITRNPAGLVQRINGATGLSSSITISNTTGNIILASITIPANDAVAGATYRIRAWGIASAHSGTTPTVNLQWYIGGSRMAQTGNLTVQSGMTNRPWTCEAYAVCVTAGASGSFFGQMLTHETMTVSGTLPVTPNVKLDGASTSTGIDTTSSVVLSISGQFGTANVDNTIICEGAICERVS